MSQSDRDQRFEQNRVKAQGYLHQYDDRMHRNSAELLSRTDPNDPHLRMSAQVLALSHITEGVRLLFGMGMNESDVETLAARAAQRAKVRQQLEEQEIEADEAEKAEADYVNVLADAHTKHQDEPGGGVDPDAKKVAPAPAVIDTSVPAAVRDAAPSQSTGQMASPPNSPQDKLAMANIASGGQTVADANAAADANTQAPQKDAGPSSDQTNFATDPAEKEKVQADIQRQQGDLNAQGTGTADNLGVADQIDGDVVKANGKDAKAKAAADAKAAAANAAA